MHLGGFGSEVDPRAHRNIVKHDGAFTAAATLVTCSMSPAWVGRL